MGVGVLLWEFGWVTNGQDDYRYLSFRCTDDHAYHFLVKSPHPHTAQAKVGGSKHSKCAGNRGILHRVQSGSTFGVFPLGQLGVGTKNQRYRRFSDIFLG